ncbi:MAG: right-handed parallel beta-helix repeat-containing protein, partial [Candidatus Cloacimonetes bacterium]|nr:right-handed parallel beta-helix repeat-containing protein [Candidatus Cloacimonadota bacterium]
MCKEKKSIVAIFMLIPLLICATLYVDDDYTAGNTGNHTWGVDAFDNIQDAIDVCSDGDDILIYEGLYCENIDIEGDVSMTLHSEIISGEYLTETTILQGATGGGDLFTIHRESTAEKEISIAGLYIAHSVNENGRGINITSEEYNSNASVSIEHCIISDNHINDNMDGDGGGIQVTAATGIFPEGNISIQNCTISDNSSLKGGGISIKVVRDNIAITNCNFSDNHAILDDTVGGTGGGIRINSILQNQASTNSVQITNCDFNNNICDDNGGGISLASTNNIETLVDNCTFDGCDSYRGGGIYLFNMGHQELLDICLISNCIFENNNANQIENAGGNGGGVCAISSYLTVINSSFIENTAGQSGGGIYFGSKDESEGCKAYCNDLYLNGNIAGLHPNASIPIGGGLGCSNIKKFTGENLVAIDNVCENEGLGGGIGVFGDISYPPNITITNSFINGNTVWGCGGGLYLGRDYHTIIENVEINNNQCLRDGAGIYSESIDLFEISNCQINGNTGGTNNMNPPKGGGVFLDNVKLEMDNCEIFNNSNSLGSGLYFDNYETTGIINNIRNSIISGNNRAQGSTQPTGAIFVDTNQEINITNCTITDNEENTEGVGGIEVDYHIADGITLINCILWGNAGDQYNDLITHITYSDLEVDNVTGDGNINLDPVFNNPATEDYSLRYDSPCINTGDPSSIYNDPDGTRSDMGYKYHEHDIYNWNYDGARRIYLWRSFPRLPIIETRATNDGCDLGVEFVLENWNPVPDGLHVWYNNQNGVNGVYDDDDELWTWNPTTYMMNSKNGYKVNRDNGEGCVLFSRGLKCLDNVELHTEPYQETWLGYFLKATQLVLDAFPQDVLEDAIAIYTMEWAISRTSTNAPWSGSPEYCKLNYMDCVVIKTVNESNNFTWETPVRSEEPEYRPVAEHFTFSDDIEYLPVYVEFVEDDLPQEVAIFVNDECRGAQVVEDTLCQICAHILEEELGQDIEFAFW